MKKLIVSKENPNGILMDLTSEEISIREKDLEHIKEIKDAREKIKTDKTSGKTKLKNLGLTDDEIKALVG
mgnify:CR=1 FL=1|jgi:hypothetical protein|tara:strand:- start:76 stop:285 length:210 start_codon:yes stop_codon:yes gene_type:complete